MEDNKTQFVSLLSNLISNNDVDKRVLADALYEHLKQCELTQYFDAETRKVTIERLVNDIEDFVGQPTNLAFIDNLRLQLISFPLLIIN